MNADHNTTISLPRLIQELSEAGGIDAATSRKFIHEFFALIEDTLVQGQQVKIKGIGTFLTEDRENGIVRFTPDPDLAAAVNAPFAMFAPVELGEGISAEELDEETDTAEKAMTDTEELPQPAEISEISPENPATATDDIEQKTDTSDVTDDADDTAIGIDIDAAFDEDTTDETEEASSIATDNEICHHGEPDEATPDINDNETEPVHMPEEQPENDSTANDCQRSMLWKYILTGAVTLAIGFAAGYICRDMKAGQADDINIVVDDYVTDSIATQTVPEENPADSAYTITSAGTLTEAKQVQIYDTISAKNYLATMARHHYGHMEYWVYIYEANPGLGHPDRIKPGTIVMIPTEESFAQANDSATMTHALQLYADIYGRYRR